MSGATHSQETLGCIQAHSIGSLSWWYHSSSFFISLKKGSPKCSLNPSQPCSAQGTVPFLTERFPGLHLVEHTPFQQDSPLVHSCLSVPPPHTDQGRTLASDPLFLPDTRPSAAANCQHLQPAPIRARTAISPRGRPCLLPLNQAMEPRL